MINQIFKKKSKDIHAFIKDVQESEKKGFNEMFEAYYQLGKAYYKENDFEHALHFLNRANSLSLSIDKLDVLDDAIDDCSNMLLDIENKGTFLDTILQEVNEKAKLINYDQRSLWNLLTLCRMETIFSSFAKIPHCDIFNQISDITDLLYHIIIGDIEYDESREDFLDELYDFGDSYIFYDPQTTISFPTLDQPIQLFDFVGGDVITSLNMFVDHEFHYTDIDEFTNDFVVSALGVLKSYYIRTQDQDIHQIPQIQKEIERIRSDYLFISDIVEEEEFVARVKQYKQLNIFD